MDSAKKAEWVAALRSGFYVQGRGTLRKVTPDGVTRHCCLGVLCDISPEVGEWSGESGRHDDLAAAVEEFRTFEGGLLVGDLSEYASDFGLHDHDQNVLTGMNDGKQRAGVLVVRAHSFTEIADWIEENL